jgi:hypothetical protein
MSKLRWLIAYPTYQGPCPKDVLNFQAIFSWLDGPVMQYTVKPTVRQSGKKNNKSGL